jgi:hypothetical protein
MTALWSSGQSSWLQIQRSRVRFPGTTRGKKAVGLERGPFSLVNTTEELFGRNSSGSGLEIREYGRRDSSRWPHGTLYPQKVRANFADKRRSLATELVIITTDCKINKGTYCRRSLGMPAQRQNSTGSFQKSFTTLKASINVFRGHVSVFRTVTM